MRRALERVYLVGYAVFGVAAPVAWWLWKEWRKR
jgi:hypothetical protein